MSDAVFGIPMLIIWCGLGFWGDWIRVQKGYDGGSLGAVLWGGAIYFLVSLILPTKG